MIPGSAEVSAQRAAVRMLASALKRHYFFFNNLAISIFDGTLNPIAADGQDHAF